MPQGKQIIEGGRGKKRTCENRGYRVTGMPDAEQNGTKKAKTEAQTETNDQNGDGRETEQGY